MQRAYPDVDEPIHTFPFPVLAYSSSLRAGSLLRSESLAPRLRLMASKTRDLHMCSLPPPVLNLVDQHLIALDGRLCLAKRDLSLSVCSCHYTWCVEVCLSKDKKITASLTTCS